jgi:streptomycin 6-kinase
MDAWRARVPALAAACAERWGLVLEEPYEEGAAAVVFPAGDAVLKLQWPHRESDHEADALRRWDGDGAIRLLDENLERNALLLERCTPGTHLSTIGPEAATGVIIALLHRLLVPAGEPFTPLAEEATHWAEELPASWEGAGRPFERSLVDAALDTVRDLPPSQPEHVLLHQDLHADNVLAAEREPWLAIDPKPLVGERAFAAAPVVRAHELGHSKAAVRRRLDRLSDELGLDRERARRWAQAQTLAWAFDDTGAVMPEHVQTARWLGG